MIYTFDDILNGHEMFKDCILGSVPKEVIEKAAGDKHKTGIKQLDISLVIDGVEVEPSRLSDIFDNLEKYIEEAGKEYAKEKYRDIIHKAWNISEKLDELYDDIFIENDIPRDRDC